MLNYQRVWEKIGTSFLVVKKYRIWRTNCDKIDGCLCHRARSLIDPNRLQILVTALKRIGTGAGQEQSDWLEGQGSQSKVPRYPNDLPASTKLFCLGSGKHSFSFKNRPHFRCITLASGKFHPRCLTGQEHPPGCNGNHSFGFNPTFMSAESLVFNGST